MLIPGRLFRTWPEGKSPVPFACQSDVTAQEAQPGSGSRARRDSLSIHADPAGNEPPLLIRAGGAVDSLEVSGPVVGVIPEARFRVMEIALQPGDTLLVFTDGITDALNGEEVAFGNERLRRALLGSTESPSELLDRLERQLRGHVGAAAQFDDITMLAVRRTG